MKSNFVKEGVFDLFEFTVLIACNYMLYHNLSVRESAKQLGISKTTMQKYTQDVKLIDENIYNKLQEQKQARLNTIKRGDKKMKDSYEIIGDVVREYWKQDGFAADVIVFFYQKYSNEKEWEHYQELVMCKSPEDFEDVIFLSDFCEGQTDVEYIHIVKLEDVTDYYYDSNYKCFGKK